MAMPTDAPAWLHDIQTELARAQVRSEDRFAAVESQLARLAEEQHALTPGLAARFAHVDERLGQLTGWAWENHVRIHGSSYLGRVAKRVWVLPAVERERLLADDDAEEIGQADLVCSARDPHTGASPFVVAEISASVDSHDVQRAADRAALLAKTGTPALAVVVGQRLGRDAARQAAARGVATCIFPQGEP